MPFEPPSPTRPANAADVSPPAASGTAPEEAGNGDARGLALPLSRADLHVHTNASVFKYFRAANSRDSYSDPDEVYRLCKARGMDFVTFTDHDTVDGCLRFQDRHPALTDFFVSAEIETFFPKTGHRIHVNVFDLTARQHAVIHRKRRNIFDLVEYLKAEDLLFSANHMFQSYRFRQAPEVFVDTMLRLFDVFEVKNGTMAYQHNAMVEDLLGAVKRKRGSLALIGGSDAHTYPPVASVFTLAPGPTWKEFLASIRQGKTVAWGSEMGFTRVLLDVYGLLGKFYRSVTDFKNPDYTRAQKAKHFLLAAAALPINVAGIPAAIWSLNYAKQVALSNTFKNRFAKMGLSSAGDEEPDEDGEA